MVGYTRHQWQNDTITGPYGPVSAARLGDMEDGIYAAILGSGIVYNPMHSDYGAAGNGTSDDSAEVQGALDAINNAGGGILLLTNPFKVTTALTYGSKTTIMGLGKNGPGGFIAGGGIGQVLKSKATGGMIQRVAMRDFSITGDGSTSGQRGLQLLGVELSEIRNLYLPGFTGTGQVPVELTSWNDSGTYRPSRENALYSIETSGVNGIKLTKNGSDPSTSGSNNNKLYAPRCSAYTNIGIDIDAGEGNSVYGGVCSTATDATTGIRVNDDVNALYSCNTDTTAGGGNTCIGVQVTSGVNDTIIVGRTGNGPTTLIDDQGTNTIILRHSLTHIGGTVKFGSASTGLGFFGTTTHGLITITGAKAGNVALTNLLAALANYGLIVDSTT